MLNQRAVDRVGRRRKETPAVDLGPIDYVVFEDEGHGFRKSENRIEGYEGVLKFLDTHLKGAGAEEAAH